MSNSGVRWSSEQYAEYLKRNGLKADGQLPNPKPKRDKTAALVGMAKREEKIVGRIRVCFTLFRVRPLDPDAAGGSTKDLLDGIKKSALVPDDDPWSIKLEVEQVRVSSYSQEKTEIEIRY